MKFLKTMTTFSVVALAALASACAQTPTPPYQRAGTHEAELNLMRRLIEIAEGPPPSREALEVEFGLTYKKNHNYTESIQTHIATGQFPFNPGYASYYMYAPRGKIPLRYEISFKLMTKEQLREANQQFCVSREDIATELMKRNWERHRTVWQPHNVVEEGYFATLNGYRRSVFFFPQSTACVGTIALDFNDFPLTSPNSSSTPSTQTPGNQK
jgi:hypothetical protein